MESLEHQLIRSKRRTLSLEINEQGKLIVRAPLRTPLFLIHDFLSKKKNWINKNQHRVQQNFQIKSQRQFKAGESFLFLGENYSLEIVAKASQPLCLNTNFQLVEKYIPKAQDIFIQWYKNQALSLVTEIVEKYADKMQLSYESIKISSAKKRWGSCSSKGHLNFSWRLMMAPISAIEYVVVHELAHLRHMNHSKRFWQLVEKFFPEHKKTRRWLKEHDHLMDIPLSHCVDVATSSRHGVPGSSAQGCEA